MKDNKFIELALNGEASHLITRDTDLLVLHSIQDIVCNISLFLFFPSNSEIYS